MALIRCLLFVIGFGLFVTIIGAPLGIPLMIAAVKMGQKKGR